MKRYFCLTLVAAFAGGMICLSAITAQQPDSPKPSKDKAEKAQPAEQKEAKLVDAVNHFRAAEKALDAAWDAYKKYKSPERREWEKKQKEAADKKAPFYGAAPPDISDLGYKKELQQSLGITSNLSGRQNEPNGPFYSPSYSGGTVGSTAGLEALSKTKHMEIGTAERVKLFAKVLVCIAERDEAWHAMEKEIKKGK